jgi:hypothetical protein
MIRRNKSYLKHSFGRYFHLCLEQKIDMTIRAPEAEEFAGEADLRRVIRRASKLFAFAHERAADGVSRWPSMNR